MGETGNGASGSGQQDRGGGTTLLEIPLLGMQIMVGVEDEEIEWPGGLGGDLVVRLERLIEVLTGRVDGASDVDEMDVEIEDQPDDSGAVDTQQNIEQAIKTLQRQIPPEEFLRALEAEGLYVDLELPSVCGSRYGELPPPVDSGQRFDYDDTGRLVPLVDPHGNTTTLEYERPSHAPLQGGTGATPSGPFGVRYLLGTEPSPLVKVFDAVEQLPQLGDLARDSGMPEQMFRDTVRQHSIWALNGQHDGSAFTQDTTREIIDSQFAVTGVRMDDEQRDRGVQASWAAIDATLKPFRPGPTPEEPDGSGGLTELAKKSLGAGGSLPGMLGPGSTLGQVLDPLGGNSIADIVKDPPPVAEPHWHVDQKGRVQKSERGLYPPERVPPMPEFPPRKEEPIRLDDGLGPERLGWKEGIMNDPPRMPAMDNAHDGESPPSEAPKLGDSEPAPSGFRPSLGGSEPTREASSGPTGSIELQDHPVGDPKGGAGVGEVGEGGGAKVRAGNTTNVPLEITFPPHADQPPSTPGSGSQDTSGAADPGGQIDSTDSDNPTGAIPDQPAIDEF